MAKFKVGINGMGRIGRTILRESFARSSDEFEVVAVNNPGKTSDYTHLLAYDSLHGKFDKEVSIVDDNFIQIADRKIRFFNLKDPAEIPWGKHDVDIVIDATGIFKDKKSLSLHKRDSVKKVIMCAPGKDLDGTFVVGINSDKYDASNHDVVSNASCTTNCLSPIAKVLHENFVIKHGLMTTIHSYTSDQRLLDSSHSDMRRSRAAAMSMIPTTTGAAKAVGLVIPELQGKLDGFAIRVPTPNVSMVDLCVTVQKEATIESVNAALKKAADGALKGVLKYETLPLVSQDFMGMRESSCVDLALTNVMESMVKVVAWYDNEAGFSNRVIDLAAMMGNKL